MPSVHFFVGLSAFFWAANFVLAPVVMTELSAFWAAAIRFLLAAALMMVIARARREDVLALAGKHGGFLALLGVVGIAGFNIFFFLALQHTSAVNASLIMASNPLLTSLLAALIGEKITRRQLLAIPLALGGVFIVISGGGRISLAQAPLGDMLMLAANFAWASYNVLCRRYLPSVSPAASSALMMSAGAAVLLLAAISMGGPLLMPGAKASMALAVMVLFGTVFAYLFWNRGIGLLGAGKTAIFLNLIPVFVMLIEAGMGNFPSVAQVLGAMLVVGGVSLAMLPPKAALAA